MDERSVERLLDEADEMFADIRNLTCPDCGRVDIEGGFVWHEPVTERCDTCHREHIEAENRRLRVGFRNIHHELSILETNLGDYREAAYRAGMTRVIEGVRLLAEVALAGEEPPEVVND